MHNKQYALKLVQGKLNGLNNYSYSQISSLTGFTKRHLIRLSHELNKKDIDSIGSRISSGELFLTFSSI